MIIKTTDELIKICEKSSNIEYITVDTEFIRKKGAYYPEPSLIQLSIDGKVGYICDVLDNTIDLQPLCDLLTNPSVIKVFHSFKQDLHVIYKLFKVKPSNVFDVQIAAMFLGKYNTPSYNVLVNDFLGIKLDKELQFSDWLSRPLLKKQLEYAERDVTYLFKLFPIIRDRLGYDKYNWVIEEMKNILEYSLEAELRDKLESTALKIVHKKKKINPRYLWLLNIGLKWREEYSLEKNIVRHRIIEIMDLWDFMYKIDKHLDNLDKSKVARNKVTRSILKRVQEAMIQGMNLEETSALVELTIKKKDVVHTNHKIYEELKKTLKICSISKSINPNLICDKADIVNIVAINDLPPKLNSGWRYEVFGNEAEKLIKNGAI